MAHNITFSPDAWADYLYWQSEDKKTLKRINRLLQELQRDGAVQGIGKAELLRKIKGMSKRLQVWKQSSKNFRITDATMTAEDKAVSLNVTYLLAAGNLYVVTYKIYPNGIVNVNAKFTSTDMQPTETEVSEATRMATFTPGSDAARKAASKLEVPQKQSFRLRNRSRKLFRFGF
jgi:Txe/YoeB family toxin of Txe-Axe toxin-antitoxin module